MQRLILVFPLSLLTTNADLSDPTIDVYDLENGRYLYSGTAPEGTSGALDADIAGTVAVERALASLSGPFCLLALLLSTLGLFAALTLAVVYRTPEIAVRVAVGASPRQASRVVWEPVVKIALAGIGAGTVVSAWLAHRVEPLLYDVHARDTSQFLVACAVVCAVAALAGYVPSRWVARVDPAAALKSAG